MLLSSTIKIDLLHLIVVPKLGGSLQFNYSTKTRQAGQAYEQSIHTLFSDFDSMYWLTVVVTIFPIICVDFTRREHS
jgi:hypothetical protein